MRHPRRTCGCDPGGAGAKVSVATLAAAEPLAPIPAPYPAELTVERRVSAQALVALRGNLYSVPPDMTRPLLD